MSPIDCRRLLDAPDPSTPLRIRDRALLCALAYSACRVGELVLLTVGDLRMSGEHHVLSIYGKGGKERFVPLHVEAVERLNLWIEVAGIDDDRQGALFPPVATPRGNGCDGFIQRHLTTRAVENLVRKYANQIGLDPAVTVHSLRVTALTTARERGAEIIDLQDFAGHADPRTTLAYIRSVSGILPLGPEIEIWRDIDCDGCHSSAVCPPHSTSHAYVRGQLSEFGWAGSPRSNGRPSRLEDSP